MAKNRSGIMSDKARFKKIEKDVLRFAWHVHMAKNQLKMMRSTIGKKIKDRSSSS
jgi:hypothetical protein